MKSADSDVFWAERGPTEVDSETKMNVKWNSQKGKNTAEIVWWNHFFAGCWIRICDRKETHRVNSLDRNNLYFLHTIYSHFMKLKLKFRVCAPLPVDRYPEDVRW